MLNEYTPGNPVNIHGQRIDEFGNEENETDKTNVFENIESAGTPVSIERSSLNNEIQDDIELSIKESPKDSVLNGISVTIDRSFKSEFSLGKAIFGLSGKELKENVKAAIDADKSLKMPLRILKGIGRGAGLISGMVLNLVSRVVAFAVSATVSVLIMGTYLIGALFKGRQSELWKDPTKAMSVIFSSGMVAGAVVGAVVGTVGNVLVQASLSMKLEPGKTFLEQAAGRAFADNAVASIGDAAIGSTISLINPLLWRAAFKS